MFEIGQKVAVASSLLSLKNPGRWGPLGFGGFLLLLGAGLGCGCGAGCICQVVVLGSNVPYSVSKV